MKPKILVITPVHHIRGVVDILESFGDVVYLDDPSWDEVLEVIADYDAIYTNPNKSKVFIDSRLINTGKNLKVICTASTGTNHIDKICAAKKNVAVIALTEEREIINRISSTAELAFAITLSSLRHVVRSHNDALLGHWDYTNYIGRQMNSLTVGVVGFGRLGSMYANYCYAFGSTVCVFDPYKKVEDPRFEQVADIEVLVAQSDIISIHVHVSDETLGMFNRVLFAKMKSDILLVNTSRGDVVNELDLVNFLETNLAARVATDVLSDEIRNRLGSPLLKYATKSDQVTITQHIGGMSREAQEIAYGHAAIKLDEFFQKRS